MKKIKYLFILILTIILALIIWENWPFFSTKHALVINLKLPFEFCYYELPGIENGLFLMGCLLTGFLIAYFKGLMTRFRSKKAIDMLESTVAKQKETISSLKSEVEFLQRNSAKPKPAPKPEPVLESVSTPESDTPKTDVTETAAEQE